MHSSKPTSNLHKPSSAGMPEEPPLTTPVPASRSTSTGRTLDELSEMLLQLVVHGATSMPERENHTEMQRMHRLHWVRFADKRAFLSRLWSARVRVCISIGQARKIWTLKRGASMPLGFRLYARNLGFTLIALELRICLLFFVPPEPITESMEND